ncbi:MAG: HAD family hydrolase [Candidatus Lokiarchaeota archaeon]|nr:HAD family hydrolase [Candidatus Lokiarchaeota archaeon]
MKYIEIPGFGKITIKNVVFDLNGTVQSKGKIQKNLKKRIKKLKDTCEIYLISADTRGNLKTHARKLGINYIKIHPNGISEAEAKNAELERLGKQVTVAIGNGNNDALMLKNAIIGICVLGSEGASLNCIMNSNIIVPNTLYAIDLLLDEKIIIATLRS